MSISDHPTDAVLPATARYAGRRLIVFLCMHRTGSSLATDMLAQVGMALGPYELVGASESNKYGHFESVPFHGLNRELQQLAFGFSDDLPDSPDTLRRLVACAGRWPSDMALPLTARERARELLEGLIASGPISGFKDPRTLLTWPFWRDVLAEFPGLEVVPLFLVRSPHEIAMSIFSRAKGALSYFDALDVTAVHFRRMLAVRADVSGPCPVVCFEPQSFPADLARAAEACGLTWDAEKFATVYDASCRHHEPAVISHEAQELFQQLRPDVRRPSAAENVQRIEDDAAQREAMIRTHIEHLQEQLNICRAENTQYATVLEQVGHELENYRSENHQYVQALTQCGDHMQQSREESQRLSVALQQCTEQLAEYRRVGSHQAVALTQQLEAYRDENARYVTALAQCGEQLRRYQQEAEQYAEALTHSQREMHAVHEASVCMAQQHAAEIASRDESLQQTAAVAAAQAVELKRYAEQICRLQDAKSQAEAVVAACRTEIEHLHTAHRLCHEETVAARNETAAARNETVGARNETALARAETVAAREQAAQLDAAISELRHRLGALEHELNLIKHSRTWRFREMVVTRLRAG
jgi:hypothetical protein